MGQLNEGNRATTDIAKVLQGVHFPAQKEELVQHAQSNQADGGIVDMLRHIPPGAYDSIGDVMTRMGMPGAVGDMLKGLGDRH